MHAVGNIHLMWSSPRCRDLIPIAYLMKLPPMSPEPCESQVTLNVAYTENSSHVQEDDGCSVRSDGINDVEVYDRLVDNAGQRLAVKIHRPIAVHSRSLSRK